MFCFSINILQNTLFSTQSYLTSMKFYDNKTRASRKVCKMCILILKTNI
ncbi:hypothetical protein AAJ76_5600025589 [Vairimorpha ceranae]|uniref:Uncharacterized protein n=1 Tax=Vairimorpha ceranae TaxID=40302 RepID=A0A0F9WCR7_9MICR|nr:hypothetical protein AAJ76_5600025589 [Vairimorpha ceranae]KKO74620.1 hypothetical protein AAJ76_5600025589 [Vairimorpha ceranae]